MIILSNLIHNIDCWMLPCVSWAGTTVCFSKDIFFRFTFSVTQSSSAPFSLLLLCFIFLCCSLLLTCSSCDFPPLYFCHTAIWLHFQSFAFIFPLLLVTIKRSNAMRAKTAEVCMPASLWPRNHSHMLTVHVVWLLMQSHTLYRSDSLERVELAQESSHLEYV